MPRQNFKDYVEVSNNGRDLLKYDPNFTCDSVQHMLGGMHQPVVIAIDRSGSMLIRLANGKTKIVAACDEINKIPTHPQMSVLDDMQKDCIDIQVCSFAGQDDIIVESPWKPMSYFEGIPYIEASGRTPLYHMIADSLQSVRAMRHSYSEAGIYAARPQIFIFTDGLATDSEFKQQAKELCDKYASKEANLAKVFIVLVPGEMTEEDCQNITDDLLNNVCDNFTIIKINDLDHGLPNAFSFLASSVVVGASSTVGQNMKVKARGLNLDFAGAEVKNGYVGIGKQTSFTHVD